MGRREAGAIEKPRCGGKEQGGKDWGEGGGGGGREWVDIEERGWEGVGEGNWREWG